MSEAMMLTGDFEFEALLHSVLRERRQEAEAPAGLEQRLSARLVQEETAIGRPQPFAFAESVAVRRSAVSVWFAVGAHALVLVVLLGLVAGRRQITAVKETDVVELTAPPVSPVLPRADHLGGGGGHHDLAPAAEGHLPRPAHEPIVAPKAPPTIEPRLAVEPTVDVQRDLKMANNTLPNLGIPNSSLKGSSLGNGAGSGIGSGNGNGVGPGTGGNIGGGIMHVGGSVSAPVVLVQVDPEFSEEARKAKFSGDVQVYLWVDEQGRPSHVHVVRGVGMGLDEKAVEAISQYRFKPAMKNGKPVAVDMYMDVNFRIF